MRAYELYEDAGKARALGIMSVMQNSKELKLRDLNKLNKIRRARARDEAERLERVNMIYGHKTLKAIAARGNGPASISNSKS
ncbi:hypothetical protein N8000_05275 [Rhodospirillales bacterium]|nr:hypothetical protein [Rhodospirillales bacterium]